MANVLGAKIKELRKQKGLTLEQLAEKIGSGKSYIWEIENKGVKRPSAEKLAAIAKELDVTTDYLLDNEQTEISEGLTKEMYFRKLGQLDEDDQKRIMDMIDAWSKK
ncbi:helix-turn-helix transcriptional regulator [Aliikangiella marina]|uniref:Helix-turn-helix transcriptional regulator n=1 Tax=Aliikangiella marina TaxID=1712262 RepID=A0A545T7A7_9GAMM|nr:helix-turn-helix transcriptional regulator [Aliikangiella marina]TQV73106.1 helix-turn-helix transcriptional regulator [Aliikangiella marina]